jgi:hypothetical protein
MRRRRLLLLGIAIAVLVFLAISALLARAFSVDGAERSAITTLIQAQARGDAAGMAAQIAGCAGNPSCRARVAVDAQSLKRAGRVAIIQIQPSAGFSLTGTLGTARVAWNVGGSLPIVQCVRVRRTGNAISGLHVQLLEVSRRIKSDTACPARY